MNKHPFSIESELQIHQHPHVFILNPSTHPISWSIHMKPIITPSTLVLAQVANALAQHAGLLPDQEPTEPMLAPVPPLVEMSEMIHDKMLHTAMVSFGDGSSVFCPFFPPVDLRNLPAQWPFQEHKLEVPTIYRAYVRRI